MHTSLPPAALAEYVARQTEAFFPDGATDRPRLRLGLDGALERLAHCFGHIHQKYYRRDGEPTYDHLHTDQHAALLYLLSHVLHAELGETALAAKAYALNKALHGLDVFYEVELPAVFLFQHPVGTVLGRARYADHLVVYQGVTVGSNLDGDRPQLGDGVVLFGGSRVLGRARLGANTWIAPAAVVMDVELPDDSVVFGMPPATQRRPTRRDVVRDVFGGPAGEEEP
jgi:serine O-acetyltransferase